MWQKCYFRMWFWKCLYKLFMRKTLNSIVITVAKISLKSSIWKYVYKLFMNYKLVQLYENEKFNCDQCGKYFARRCNLKVLIQNVHENSWIELWTLANISPKHSICGKSFTKSQRNYDCDSCRKLSTQLENLNKHIMGIHARQRNYKCVSLNQQVWWFISRLSFKDKEIINVITMENSILKWQIWRYISKCVILVKNSSI